MCQSSTFGRASCSGIFIGKWINEGHTVGNADPPGVSIVTSDVYEWVPGGFAVLHCAYGRIGDFGGGGVAHGVC